MKNLILENTFSWNYKLKHLNEATLSRGEMLKKIKDKYEKSATEDIDDAAIENDAMMHMTKVLSDKDELEAYYNKLYNELREKLKKAIIQKYITPKGEDPNSEENIEFIEDILTNIENNPKDATGVSLNKYMSFKGPEDEGMSDDNIDWSEEAIDKYLEKDEDDPEMTASDYSSIAKWKKDKRPINRYMDETGKQHRGKGLPRF